MEETLAGAAERPLLSPALLCSPKPLSAPPPPGSPGDHEGGGQIWTMEIRFTALPRCSLALIPQSGS